MPISRLPVELVSRIAAGEVIERPASAVKELVENAMDAGATRIAVDVRDGGRYIRVADNGAGIAPDELPLAFEAHATSKLVDIADLERIATLGFRGEALASLAAVAERLVCETRREADTHGWRFVAGESSTPEPCATAPGTVMTLTGLFAKVPARLKFLKKDGTELNHVKDVVEQLTLSHPEVALTLTSEGKEILRSPGDGDAGRLARTLFDLKEGDLLPVAYTDDDWQITGWTARPEIRSRNRRRLHTFVNARPLRCGVLARAIEMAYESLIPPGHWPPVVLFLELPAGAVDVNVHPTKREVRYVDPSRSFAFVRHALKTALERAGISTLMPAMFPQGPGGASSSGWASRPDVSAGGGWRTAAGGPWGGSSSGLANFGQAQAALNAQAPLAPHPTNDTALPTKPEWRVIGQLFNTFVLLETIQGLMVVDQHIASERYWFERIKTTANTETAPVQPLMTSLTFHVTSEQAERLEASREALNQLGFGFELQGDTLTPTAIPAMYTGRVSPRQLWEGLLTRLEGQPLEGQEVMACPAEGGLPMDDLIATLACHSAVRAGDALRQDEMTDVIKQWLGCTLPWTCPHGRPIAHTIQTRELMHLFERPSLPMGTNS